MEYLFWVWTAHCFLIGGGSLDSNLPKPPVEVNAVLSGEVTFPVRISDGFEIEDIRWIFKETTTVAIMRPGKNWFKERLSKMDENGSLKIRNLSIEDSGTYCVEIASKTKSTLKETQCYELKVFRRMKANITHISSLDSANETCFISFNCTVNNNTNVSYIWSAGKVGPSVEPVLSLNLTKSESNLNVCCTVKNPVSEASDCVLPRNHCFPDGGGSGDEFGGSSVDTVAIAVSAICSCAACAAVIGILCKNMSARGRKDQAVIPTVYAQINSDNTKSRGGNHCTPTEEKNPMLNIYADVQNTLEMKETKLPPDHLSVLEKDTTFYADLLKPQGANKPEGIRAHQREVARKQPEGKSHTKKTRQTRKSSIN